MSPLALLTALILLAIALRFAAARLNLARVRRFIEQRSGTVLECRSFPGGSDWLGDESVALCAVLYLDDAGLAHRAICTASLWNHAIEFVEDRMLDEFKSLGPASDGVRSHTNTVRHRSPRARSSV